MGLGLIRALASFAAPPVRLSASLGFGSNYGLGDAAAGAPSTGISATRSKTTRVLTIMLAEDTDPLPCPAWLYLGGVSFGSGLGCAAHRAMASGSGDTGKGGAAVLPLRSGA